MSAPASSHFGVGRPSSPRLLQQREDLFALFPSGYEHNKSLHVDSLALGSEDNNHDLAIYEYGTNDHLIYNLLDGHWPSNHENIPPPLTRLTREVPQQNLEHEPQIKHKKEECKQDLAIYEYGTNDHLISNWLDGHRPSNHENIPPPLTRLMREVLQQNLEHEPQIKHKKDECKQDLAIYEYGTNDHLMSYWLDGHRPSNHENIPPPLTRLMREVLQQNLEREPQIKCNKEECKEIEMECGDEPCQQIVFSYIHPPGGRATRKTARRSKPSIQQVKKGPSQHTSQQQGNCSMSY